MKLIVAVSGGVDSVVMLDVLVKQRQHELVVAHVNHGIRDDSDDDETLVRKHAQDYSLPYVSVRLGLGPKVSEEYARRVRHEWLLQQLQEQGADQIATAHHEDDIIETIAINLKRGTGWRGLCSLRETAIYMRPLLTWGKTHIVTYAIENSLLWREDSTNEDVRYTRNYLRHGSIRYIDVAKRQRLLELYRSQCNLLTEIDDEVMHFTPRVHNRYFLTMLDQTTACELLRAWLPEPLERRRLLDLWLFAKTAHQGSRWSLDGRRFICVTTTELVVTGAEN